MGQDTSVPVYRAGSLTYTRRQLAWLFVSLLWGDFCFMMLDVVVPSIIPLKLKALGASNTTMGIVLTTIPMALSILLNPAVSFRSDRKRTPRGRRIPYILSTLIPLVLCLLAISRSDSISEACLPLFRLVSPAITPGTAALLTLSGFMTLFMVFDTIVMAAFWYLTNDVIPEPLQARFLSWFRLVSTLTVSGYNFFLFKYAETHSTAIFTAVAIIYGTGFAFLCFSVKEGEYPPPAPLAGGRNSAIAAIRTYARDCLSVPHYLTIFAMNVCMGFTVAMGPFMIFFQKSIGMDLTMAGNAIGVTSIAISLLILVSGWLADRFHPIRIVILGLILQTAVVAPVQCIWLIIHPAPQTAYWLWIAIAVCLHAPAQALIGVLDPPLLMRLLPREKYGQFASANSIFRSLAYMAGGLLAGRFLDSMQRVAGGDFAYRFIPVWTLAFSFLALLLSWQVFRSWKRHGGDANYTPPEPVI